MEYTESYKVTIKADGEKFVYSFEEENEAKEKAESEWAYYKRRDAGVVIHLDREMSVRRGTWVSAGRA